jgi:hypothetical protein
MDILKILCENKLIYVYKMNEEDQIRINRNIKFVFAIERYSKNAIINEFVA